MIDFVLVLTALEWIALTVFHRRTGRGVAGGAIAGNLLAGGCLLLGVRCALTGAAWPLVALCLAGSLAAHLVDLGQRWR